jgi:O-antigen ligase
VEGGINLTRDRPVWGWGSGSFGAAFAADNAGSKATVSHTEPLTVAAEQGAIGFIVYVAVVLLSLVVLLRGARESVAATAIAACFVALLVHSLGYADFAVDPATWALLGVGIAIRRQSVAGGAASVGAGAASRSAREPRPAPA